MTLGLLLRNGIALLLVPLAFFLLVAAVRASSRKDLPMAKVWLTVQASLLGILFTVFVRTIGVPPGFGSYIEGIQGLILLFCFANLASYLFADLYLHYKMKGEVPSFFRELLHLAVYLFFGATALRVVFDINMTSILTTTTVLTAAVAFAMQTTLASIVSGFYIQADGNFRRRTWIRIKDKEITGEIVNVGFRYTTVRTTEGHRVHIPNNFLTQNVVHTIGNREEGPAGINLKVQLDYSFRPERARELLLSALLDEPGILPDPAPSVRVDAFQDSGIRYNLRFHLEEYGTILTARDGILQRVWYAVMREGQSFPYPHREVVRKAPEPPFRMEDGAIRECLRRIEILAPLGEEDLDALARNVRLRVFGGGETVVRQGAAGDSLFIVLRGELEALVDREKVGELSDGDFFGEMSLLTGENRRATVRAIAEVRLVEISKAAIEPIIRSHPSVLAGLSVALSHRLERNLTARQVREETAEAPTLSEAILRRLQRFFGIS